MPQASFSPAMLRVIFWIFALGLGALHTWAGAYSNSMNPDGIAYLDIGDAYLRGDWDTAINRYWSPLYSWLLGIAMQSLHPSMHWEFPVVHVVNFFVYLVALLSFEFFWLALMRSGRQSRQGAVFPEWAWMGFGYSLFIYTSLVLIKIWTVTPDMLVAALTYLAAGLIVRIRAGTATWGIFALLGMVLGVSYLAKTAMFPLAFVFLAVTFVSVGDLRRATKLVPVALCSFLFVAAPYIALLSTVKGSFTYGDTGKLMYAWHINNVPHPHWQGEVPGAGSPRHTSVKVFDSPPIYKFGGAAVGTYPVAYDPAYWYEGVTPYFDLKGHLKVLLGGIEYYFDLFFRQQGPLAVGLLILLFLMRPRAISLRSLPPRLGLAIVAVVALGMYAVVHVQPRYIGAFVVLLWADLFSAVRLADSLQSRRLLALVGALLISVNFINILAFNVDGMRNLAGLASPNRVHSSIKAGPRSLAGDVAAELNRLGIQSGDKVAVIGYAFTSFWARLARVQIVAEMFGWEADLFWLAEPPVRAEMLKAFASTGARAIVAERVPHYVSPGDWHRVGSSNYYIYVLT